MSKTVVQELTEIRATLAAMVTQRDELAKALAAEQSARKAEQESAAKAAQDAATAIKAAQDATALAQEAQKVAEAKADEQAKKFTELDSRARLVPLGDQSAGQPPVAPGAGAESAPRNWIADVEALSGDAKMTFYRAHAKEIDAAYAARQQK